MNRFQDNAESYAPQCNNCSWHELSNNIKVENSNIISINMRSIVGKFGEFVSYLNVVKKPFTFIVLTETWLSESTDYGYDIEGYESLSVYRCNQRGGGIKIYHQINTKVDILDELSGVTGPCESET